MGRFDGKVALLTGAGAGIAKAAAVALAREGARVGLLEIDPEAGRKAEQDIVALGGEALFVQTDVTDEDNVKAAVEAVVERFGRLDIIVNAAGGSSAEDRPVEAMEVEVWMRVMKLNLLHPFLTSKYGVPHLIKAGGGSIIHFSSAKGLMGSDRPAYAASKGGIISLTRTMAAQCADYGIRVNAIAPGAVQTERTARQHAVAAPEYLAMREKRRKMFPFSAGDSDAMTGAILFLASDDSRMFTGTTLEADGGVSAYLNLAEDKQ